MVLHHGETGFRTSMKIFASATVFSSVICPLLACHYPFHATALKPLKAHERNVFSDVGVVDEKADKCTVKKHEASERDGRNVREVPAVLLQVPSDPSRQ